MLIYQRSLEIIITFVIRIHIGVNLIQTLNYSIWIHTKTFPGKS